MISDIAVLLPCHSLDDFPTHRQGDEAQGLLAAWSALWHPALIAAIGKTPGWHPAGEPPPNLSGQLFVVPAAAVSELPPDFLAEASQQGAVVIENLTDRSQIVAAALTPFDPAHSANQPQNNLEKTLADDFLALGFCHLQGDLLNRRMRYSSHLDEAKFERATLAAANAWVSGDAAEVKSQLGVAFNALLEARGQYYPVDAYLIDVILIAPTTVREALRNELAGSTPRNVLISAGTLKQMADLEPNSLKALREGIENGTIGLMGGDFDRAELPLMTHESILAELEAAAEVYRQHLGRQPAVFGRRSFALDPVLPQILHETGFTAAWHVALDAGHFPKSDRRKIRWEGVDGTSIDALAGLPLDANSAESYLQLAETLGSTMDDDFVATLLFARWPGHASDFHRDLLRMAAYAPVLGKFVTVDDYFRETAESSIRSKFSPDQYRTPYLQQAVSNGDTNPISKHADLLATAIAQESGTTVTTMTAMLTGTLFAKDGALAEFASALPRATKPPEAGLLLVNPLNFTRHVAIELSPDPTTDSADANGIVKRTIAEIPPLGFAWVGATNVDPSKPPGPAMASENVLRNQFCEVTISPSTGGVQSIYDLRTHGNRLSQQLAVRLPRTGSTGERSSDPDESPYTTMLADSVEIESNDDAFGKITSRGQLLDPAGRQLARFSQATSLWRASRVVQIEIAVSDFIAELESDPWNSYLACRFAWPDHQTELRRSVHGCNFPSDARRLEAPQFVELVGGSLRTAILTGGLPYHRRIGARMLDSLLAVCGETATSFRLGIGIDVPHPWRAAQELLSPPMIFRETAAPAVSGDVGWLFHIDAPNVSATHWSPLLDSGRVVGFRVRLLESEGRWGRVTLRSFRAPTSAVQTSLRGEPQSTLSIEGDAIGFEMAAYEWRQIEARW